ncbi:hypothetical protein LV84_02089 [Algoriphagus ratkowskyi]|uniref:Uncharacterized protein n=1 Tax=Algoriphagus ratkowskyi TaxID=57028 RepID=A0A2W7REZ6_9BACT|nr:hypothetical protein LV84_02089 [Algoriphagus ratkowskyi]
MNYDLRFMNYELIPYYEDYLGEICNSDICISISVTKNPQPTTNN